jgi:hypothetical protein
MAASNNWSKKQIYKDLCEKIELQIMSDLNNARPTKKIDVFGEEKIGFVKNNFLSEIDFDRYGKGSQFARDLTDEIYKRLHFRQTATGFAATYVIRTSKKSTGLSLGSDGLYSFLNKLIN